MGNPPLPPGLPPGSGYPIASGADAAGAAVRDNRGDLRFPDGARAGGGACCPAAVATAGAAAVGGCGPPWPQVRERWRYSRCSRAAYSRLPLTGWQGSRSWPWPVSRWPVRWPQARRRRDRELRRSG